MHWTKEQRDAIDHEGGDVLVAAGAGAGKTGVLTERVVRKVVAAGWSVTDLLVVTFTDAAAAEMRRRIARKLTDALAEARLGDDPRRVRRIENQVVLLEAGQICTLHSFCSQLLREHFHHLGLDPAFEILDTDEAALVHQEVLDAVLEGYYNATGERRQRFEQLLRWCQSAGGDAWLRDTVLRLDAKINSLRSPEDWWAAVQRSLAVEGVQSMADSAWNSAIRRMFELEFDAASARLEQAQAAASAEGAGKLSAYLKPIETLREHLADLRQRLAARQFWSELADKLAVYPIGRMVSVPDSVPGKGPVKALLDEVKKSVQSLGTLTQRAERDLLADLAGLAPQARTLADLCGEYAQAYASAKRDRGVLDFADLERYALRLLAEFSEVRSAVASQFREVLVDEYQDISPVQDAILRAVAGRDPDDRGPKGTSDYLKRRVTSNSTLDTLSGPSTLPFVPLFMVGDLKQSIYRFRLAEPDIFAAMLDGFAPLAFSRASQQPPPPAKTQAIGGVPLLVHLADNFRSRRVIIDAVNAVFGQLMQPIRTLIGTPGQLGQVGQLAGPVYDDNARLRFAAPAYAGAGGAAGAAGAGQPAVPADCPVELHLLEWMPQTGLSATSGLAALQESDSSPAGSSSPPDSGDPIDSSAGEPARPRAGSQVNQAERLGQQARLVGRRIRQLLGYDGSSPAAIWDDAAGRWRPARPRDVVILLRTAARVAQKFAEELTRLGLPVHATQPGGYFEAVEVADVRALLAVLDNPRQDIPLAAVLRSPLMAMTGGAEETGEPLSADELATVRLANPQGSFYDAVVAAAGREFLAPQCILAQKHVAQPPPAVTRPPEAGEIGPRAGRFTPEAGVPHLSCAVMRVPAELRRRLSLFLDQLSAWRTAARRRPLSELLADIFRTTGYLDYVAGLVGGPQRQANLLHLASRARQFDRFARQGLARFARFLDELERAGEELGIPSALSEADDVVRIMTIHAAKGLEFPIVVLADLEHEFNTRELGDDLLFHRQLLMGLRCLDGARRIRYPSLPHRLIRKQLDLEMLLEEIRLEYVAMTRARDRLVLFASRKGLLKPLQADWAQPPNETSIVQARCALDWLAPAILATESGRPMLAQAAHIESLPAEPMHAGDTLFSVDVYSQAWLKANVGDAIGPGNARPTRSAWQESAIRGEALEARISGQEVSGSGLPLRSGDDDGAKTQAGQDAQVLHAAVVEQLRFAYPLAALAAEPAKRSVSELKHLFETRAEQDEMVPGRPVSGVERRVSIAPALGAGQGTPDGSSVPPWDRPPADDARARGLATHAVLQRLDLSAPLGDADQVARQIDALRRQRLLEPHAPDLVDVQAIAAFFASEIGRRMLDRPDRVRREWPFSLAVPVGEVNPSLPAGAALTSDRVLVQGIIDVLLEDGDEVGIAGSGGGTGGTGSGGGLIVLDFKTDAVRGEPQARERAGQYAVQLHWYARAAEAILGRKVVRRLVYFLAVGQLVEVEGVENCGEEPLSL